MVVLLVPRSILCSLLVRHTSKTPIIAYPGFRSAIAIHAPTCAYSRPAFAGMSIVCDIAAAARVGCRAKNGLPMLIRLRARAHESLSNATRTTIVRGGTVVTPLSAGVEDDLGHINGSAPRLRRVGSSPPHKGRELVMSAGSPPRTSGTINGGDNPSPNSIRSVATSDTLAEIAHYDQHGRLVDMGAVTSGVSVRMASGLGVVPSPPPQIQTPEYATGFNIMEDTAFQTSPSSIPNMHIETSGFHGTQFNVGSPTDLYENTYNWPGFTPDTWSGMGGVSELRTGEEEYMVNMSGGTEVDLSYGLGFMGDVGVQGEFDFGSFVNGLGGGFTSSG
jgi:hypothetical protein